MVLVNICCLDTPMFRDSNRSLCRVYAVFPSLPMYPASKVFDRVSLLEAAGILASSRPPILSSALDYTVRVKRRAVIPLSSSV
jgi:hypothetical protein